jgi:hypothetical protein
MPGEHLQAARPAVEQPPAARRTGVGALARLARADLRRDLRAAALLTIATLLAGAVAGPVWALLAPRADYRVVQGGAVPIGVPSPELPAADDGVFVLVLAALGLLAGAAAWVLRRHRGVVVLLALALGTLAGSVLAWQLGQLVAPSPSAAALTQVGATVTTGVRLNAPTALAVAPLLASAVYVLAALFTSADDLGRGGDEPPAPAPQQPREAALDAGMS